MASPKKTFDVWLVGNNTVYKGVPYHVVTDWVQQARLSASDRLKPSGTAEWAPISSLHLFSAYLPHAASQRVGDAAEALEPIELDFNWKKRPEDEDDDVDMIPLIDISLVLLIFFMMTTTVAAISRIAVPSMENAVKIDTNREIVRIDLDMVKGAPVYGLGKGTAAPADEDNELDDLNKLLSRLDLMLNAYMQPPRVRIAAHGELPYGTVEKLMDELDRLRKGDRIDQYYIEVNERAAPWSPGK